MPAGDRVDGLLLDRVKRLYGSVLGARGKHTALLLRALWAGLVGLGAAVVLVLPVMSGKFGGWRLGLVCWAVVADGW